jgi:hypothetical protein
MGGFNTQTLPAGASRHKPRRSPASAGSFNPIYLNPIYLPGWPQEVEQALCCSNKSGKIFQYKRLSILTLVSRWMIRCDLKARRLGLKYHMISKSLTKDAMDLEGPALLNRTL